MGVLKDQGVNIVNHYAPLHYLPFIARDRALLSKPTLAERGFGPNHLRSKSSKHDVLRGFGKYAFLTIERHPRITRAKLKAGFPHVGIAVPAEAVEQTTFDLCRYNVAMTRQLRRDGKPGWVGSSTNGRYYDAHEIPVARTDADKRAMLKEHLNRSMIEVLVHGDVDLPDGTGIITYSETDKETAKRVLAALEVTWEVSLVGEPERYQSKEKYSAQVDEFIEKALNDPSWRGNGLEFDKV